MKKEKLDVKHLEEQLLFYEHVPNETMLLKGWDEEQYQLEIEKLREQIALIKQGKMARRKGANYEREIAKKFKKSMGVTLVRTPLSGGFQKHLDNAVFKGDLTCMDEDIDFKLQIECKNQKTWKLRDWYKQAEEETSPGKIPIVIYHQNQEIKEGKVTTKNNDFVMLSLKDFLEVVDHDKIKIKKRKNLKRRSK